MSFAPYLFYSGNCAEAFERYHEIFGGELSIMRTSDMPPDTETMPGVEPHHVMHASIALGGGWLMGSDDPTGDDGPKTGIRVAYTAADPETAQKVFDQLSDGGETELPFAPTSWSRGFGMCNDRFGVPWMVDTQGEP